MTNYRTTTPKANILVIDNQVEELFFVMGSLTLHGYHVQIATNVKQAQEICENTLPDIVLGDLTILAADDHQESTLLSHPNPSMIFTSAGTETSVKMRSLELGGVHLAKPFNEKELLTSIEVLLAWQNLEKAA